MYACVCIGVLQVDRLVARSTDSTSEFKTTADKYCCVFLPDGTASLTPARPGITIRHMLTGLCEKRGLPLCDIIIYLQGKEKVCPHLQLHLLKFTITVLAFGKFPYPDIFYTVEQLRALLRSP